MQVNQEQITKQLFRAYNARGVVSPSGATGLSPVFMVGGGAHPSIATQISGVVSQVVSAIAAQSGACGLIVPSQSGQLAVVTDITIAGASTAAFYEALLEGPAAETLFAPNVFPTTRNTQNVSSPTIPQFWGYENNTGTPAAGLQIGSVVAGPGLTSRFGIVPIVLAPGWGVIVKCNTNNLVYGVDISFDAFELTPS